MHPKPSISVPNLSKRVSYMELALLNLLIVCLNRNRFPEGNQLRYLRTEVVSRATGRPPLDLA